MGTSEAPWEGLPKFKAPPVAEVAIAVEFVPVPELGALRLVQLYEAWRSRFPKAQEQVALPPSPEPVPGSVFTPFGLQIGTGPGPMRLWMLTDDEQLLVQAQHDRLILNWRRSGSDGYPSYEKLKVEFRTRWESFLSLTGDLTVRPTVAEVTFVNLIPLGGSTGDLSPVLSSASEVQLPPFAKLVSSQAQYVSEVHPREGLAGQLVITVGPSSTGDLVMNVVTRVSLAGEAPQTERVMSALDAAHATSVLGFADITTPEMHKTWGRYQ